MLYPSMFVLHDLLFYKTPGKYEKHITKHSAHNDLYFFPFSEKILSYIYKLKTNYHNDREQLF